MSPIHTSPAETREPQPVAALLQLCPPSCSAERHRIEPRFRFLQYLQQRCLALAHMLSEACDGCRSFSLRPSLQPQETHREWNLCIRLDVDGAPVSLFLPRLLTEYFVPLGYQCEDNDLVTKFLFWALNIFSREKIRYFFPGALLNAEVLSRVPAPAEISSNVFWLHVVLDELETGAELHVSDQLLERWRDSAMKIPFQRRGLVLENLPLLDSAVRMLWPCRDLQELSTFGVGTQLSFHDATRFEFLFPTLYRRCRLPVRIFPRYATEDRISTPVLIGRIQDKG